MTFESSPLSIRASLDRIRRHLEEFSVCNDVAGTVELVLAEVMNNICEHAYAGRQGGKIGISLWIEGDVLSVETVDQGCMMPAGRVPAGSAVSVDRPRDHVPEGGFGWYLIRHLATDIAYLREVGHNRLTFRMRIDAPQASA